MSSTVFLQCWTSAGSAGFGGLRSRWWAPRAELFNQITYVARDQCIAQGLYRAGSAPWVQSSVGEDNVAGGQVLFIGDPSKVVESVVVVGSDSITVEAVVGVCFVVELLWVEHVVNAVHFHGHGLISTRKNVPPAHVFIGGSVLVDFVALAFSE